MRITLVFLALLVLAMLFGDREPVNLEASFDPNKFGEGVDVYLESTESAYQDIRPGQQKQVIWAGQPEVRTPISIVYLHGFSASSTEIRPVPDLVAKALGANLFYTRLTGHGRTDPDAMGEISVNAWMQDAAEAMAVGRAIGDRVLVIATSTGGTIAAEAAVQPEMMDKVMGIVFVSPNFGMRNPLAPLLTLPYARTWLPMLAGQRRVIEPRKPGQAEGWILDYPSRAVFPLGALVKDATERDYGSVKIPALFYYSLKDRVVRPAKIEKIVALWGGPVRVVHPQLSEDDDPLSHLITGAVMSPSTTDIVIEQILNWVNTVLMQ